MSARGNSASAVAHANIALAKYWGKADSVRNLPAVPSLSLTLAALRTRTRVGLRPELEADRVLLDGQPASGRARERIVTLLDEMRRLSGEGSFAEVESSNDFPTAAGLASSASGFAALALAGARAYGVELSASELSAVARRASASAARSVFGGYVELRAGAEAAAPVLAGSELPLTAVIAVTASGPKSVGSTEGMRHTSETSPYYPAWVERAPALFEEVRAAVLARDVVALGTAAEQSALMMHASMLAARPALVYFAPATLRVIETVRALRQAGMSAFFTIDAGPHVKVFTEPASAERVAAALAALEGVTRVLVSGPGPDAALVQEEA